MVLKVGDRVRYTPKMIDSDTAAAGVVEMVEPRGQIFKMDMVSIDAVDHWIPAHECVLDVVTDRQTMQAIMQVLGPEPVCQCSG